MISPEHARDTGNVYLAGGTTLSPSRMEVTWSKTVTSTRHKHDTRSSEVFTNAPSLPKLCSLPRTPPSSTVLSKGFWLPLSVPVLLPERVKPPARNDIPRTRSMLDRIEPNSVDFTTMYSWLPRSATVIISSTAFPKVALSKPLKESFFKHAASSSVASPRILASGIIAPKFNQKVQLSAHPNIGEAIPKGTHTRRRQILLKKIVLSAFTVGFVGLADGALMRLWLDLRLSQECVRDCRR
mmetsp:Transcript_18113/g.51647  ORF Transcript_18113/g.51647 Transcript_18113/m.51647 type:complete len:240 (+) Transcript_18113:682-1401(+)